MRSELSKRVLTAFIGVFALLALLIYGGVGGVILFTLALIGGLSYEYAQMIFQKRWTLKKWGYVATSVLLALGVVAWPHLKFELVVFALLAFLFLSVISLSKKRGLKLDQHAPAVGLAAFGLLYLVVFPLHFIELRQQEDGLIWLLGFLFLNWTGDSAAYFVGKKWGSKKLAPSISPKKTWEGAFGGLVASVLVFVAFVWSSLPQMSPGKLLIIAIAVAIVSQVGDLVESLFKRGFDVKDSGSILPGHGGLMDRFDGVIISLPLMVWCVRLV